MLKDVPMEHLETINPFTLAPWVRRVEVIADESAATQIEMGWTVRVAVSSSGRNGVVGIGGAMALKTSTRSGARTEAMSCTLGLRTEHNPYSGELVAIASALETLSGFKYRRIAVVSRNKAAVLTLRHPYQQSGQGYICRIYDAIKALRRNGNLITILWIPTSEENTLLNLAKERAKAASCQDAVHSEHA